MSGMDVLRDRIAQAIFDSDLDGFPEFAEWGTHRDTYYANADAVIAALGLVEERDANVIAFRYDDRAHHWETRRRYVTPWERIEDDT